jgi:hypothetical protein
MLGGEYVTKQVWKNVIKKLSGIWKLKSGRQIANGINHFIMHSE